MCVKKITYTPETQTYYDFYFLNQVWWELTFPNDRTSHYTSACSGKKKCSGIKPVYSYTCSGIQGLTNAHTLCVLVLPMLRGRECIKTPLLRGRKFFPRTFFGSSERFCPNQLKMSIYIMWWNLVKVLRRSVKCECAFPGHTILSDAITHTCCFRCARISAAEVMKIKISGGRSKYLQYFYIL